MTHIAVLGAGIAGVTTAYHLHDAGLDVTVIDRHRYPAMETSYANGGQISASNAEVWTTRATVMKGLRWMLRRDAPLLVHPSPRWHKVSWMAEFLGNFGRYRANTLATVKLAVAARPILKEMAARTGVDYDRSDAGILHFYQTEREMAQARRVDAIYREGGLDRQELSPEEVARIEPALVTPGRGRLLDAVGCDGRHPPLHHRRRALAGGAGRRLQDGPRGRAPAHARRRRGWRRGGRRRALRRGGGLRRRGLARPRRQARRPGQRLPREGLLDHRGARRRGVARRPRRACRCSTTPPRSSPRAWARAGCASRARPSSPGSTATSAPTGSRR